MSLQMLWTEIPGIYRNYSDRMTPKVYDSNFTMNPPVHHWISDGHAGQVMPKTARTAHLLWVWTRLFWRRQQGLLLHWNQFEKCLSFSPSTAGLPLPPTLYNHWRNALENPVPHTRLLANSRVHKVSKVEKGLKNVLPIISWHWIQDLRCKLICYLFSKHYSKCVWK